jgi:ribonucleoside-diphosphate reductase alpha chain
LTKLTDNAIKLLEERYLRRDLNGTLIETPDELFHRVAKAVAQNDDDLAEKFYIAISNLDFLPNSPALFSFGTDFGSGFACYGLTIPDTIEGIFDAIKKAAVITRMGGGLGIYLGDIRPKGDTVGKRVSAASGPISFMQVFDATIECVKQGGFRKGGVLGLLPVSHPDILDFISCKEKDGSLHNFNISVAITDAFMAAVAGKKSWKLVNPRTGKTIKTMPAIDIWNAIIQHAWNNGEPGVVFWDTRQRANPTPELGNLICNLCGEQDLLPNEACSLASINLTRFIKGGEVDSLRLREVAQLVTRFLDYSIDINRFPLPENEEAVLRTRRLGLGVMGFADALYMLGIRYDSEAAEQLAKNIMACITEAATEESIVLAQERGPFPAFNADTYVCPMLDKWPHLKEAIKINGIRNAGITTIAPTGSLSFIANCSGGIEPNFALSVTRTVLGGKQFTFFNPVVETLLKEKDVTTVEELSVDYLITAHDIDPEWHIRIQAAFQEYTHNSISKTINTPNDYPIEKMSDLFFMAYREGCKGITFYRDGSRDNQVLTITNKEEPEEVRKELSPRERPPVTTGVTERIHLGCGRSLYVTVNDDEQGVCEVFLTAGHSGGCISAQSEALARLISVSLRAGIPIPNIVKQLRGIRCAAPGFGGRGALSCADAVAKVLEKRATGKVSKLATITGGPECKLCGTMLVFEEGCVKCPSCGFSQCT